MQAGFYSFPSTHWDPTFHYSEADIISPSYNPGSQDYSGWGNAINAAGNVTGSVIFPGIFQLRPFFFDGTTMVDLNPPGGGGTGNAINSFDQIVGVNGPRQPFIYKAGTSTLLSTLIDPGTGWVLSDVRGINDKGQIVGSGSINGQSHAFLDAALKANAKISRMLLRASARHHECHQHSERQQFVSRRGVQCPVRQGIAVQSLRACHRGDRSRGTVRRHDAYGSLLDRGVAGGDESVSDLVQQRL
jgi:hypothetical protein